MQKYKTNEVEFLGKFLTRDQERTWNQIKIESIFTFTHSIYLQNNQSTQQRSNELNGKMNFTLTKSYLEEVLREGNLATGNVGQSLRLSLDWEELPASAIVSSAVPVPVVLISGFGIDTETALPLSFTFLIFFVPLCISFLFGRLAPETRTIYTILLVFATWHPHVAFYG